MKIAWSILNFIPKVILILLKLLVTDKDIQEVLNQVELDTNVMSLAEIINDTFDIVEKADKL